MKSSSREKVFKEILIVEGTCEDAVATVEESIKIIEMAPLSWHPTRLLLILIKGDLMIRHCPFLISG